ncbi:hypothetical protein BDV96DRAFT_27547 [Lophiotrema nucula]|uniref:Rhodopsin domain-containing protein n=1 Tax=Lophiotrema nucula TaxID=690887 RepID=A0A6A5ZC63_9PLEO|nr:hypothetical protein BDV96DRAFT_27547 [Lophiotrema nucula]
MPLENPKYCYPMKPYTILVTAWGLVNDGIIWSLPHFVVWRLRLRLAHKIAITAIFALAFLNILMAIFRINSLMAVTFGGDITYDVVPAIIWAIAQLSIAIIVACCPLLRPVFEKMIPTRLTKILPVPGAKARPSAIARPATSSTFRVPATPTMTTVQVPPSTIRATTRIDVLPHTSRPISRTGCFHDSLQESEGPVVEITRAVEGESWSRV